MHHGSCTAPWVTTTCCMRHAAWCCSTTQPCMAQPSSPHTLRPLFSQSRPPNVPCLLVSCWRCMAVLQGAWCSWR